jgi:hypothetical protein
MLERERGERGEREGRGERERCNENSNWFYDYCMSSLLKKGSLSDA